jgi:hypothetical protein
MSTTTQTGLIAASLAILVYIAVIITGSSLMPGQDEQDEQSIISQQARFDAALYDQISSGLNYVHNATTETTSSAIPLSGISQNQFMLLYDSTPYASKGHIAMVLPCDEADPRSPLFQVLVGRAPDIAPTTLGYIEPISDPPDMCVYHAQFGFGDPVTDVILKYIANGTTSLKGPNSGSFVTITTHELYIPEAPSFEELQHEHNSTAQG